MPATYADQVKRIATPGMIMNQAVTSGFAPETSMPLSPADMPIPAKVTAMCETIERLEQYVTELQIRLESSAMRTEPSSQEDARRTREQSPGSPLWRGLDGQHDRLIRLAESLLRILNGLEV